MKVRLIWIRSTPVIDSIHNSRVPFFRYGKDILAYNQAADSSMSSHHIPIIDLYTFTENFIPNGYMDHVHFKEEVRQQQADFIAGNLVAINAHCHNTRKKGACKD